MLGDLTRMTEELEEGEREVARAEGEERTESSSGYAFESAPLMVGETCHKPLTRHESESSNEVRADRNGDSGKPIIHSTVALSSGRESEKFYLGDEVDGQPLEERPPLAAVEDLVEARSGLDMSYDDLTSRLRKRRALFKDPDFPPTASSLTFSGRNVRHLVWKRPKDIIADPQFVTRGISRFDLNQGSLGDCWFVSAAATLAIHGKLFERVVPPGQGFGKDYCGVFKFNIWKNGEWQEIVIDDYLPTLHGRLYYCSNNSQPNEFWAALLEKAYAKVHGSYEAIDAGRSFEALVDFTGGISETVDLRKTKYSTSELFSLVQRTFQMNSLQCGGIWQTKGATREQELRNGLFSGHAYSITGIAKMNIRGGKKEELLRLRNPWGRGEWNQRWSDGSAEWSSLSQQDREKLLYRPLKDGEFWMPFEDFCANFDALELCHLTPDALTAELAKDTDKKQWEEKTLHGEWAKYVSAGGCGNPPNNDMYWINPQYNLKLDVPDSERNDGQATVVLSLTQKHRRRMRTTLRSHSTNIAIGLAIWKLRRGVEVRLDGKNYNRRALLHSKTIDIYSPKREVYMRARLPLGNYVIIPSTFEPHDEAEFMLRVFTEVKAETEVVEETTTVVTEPEDKERELLERVFNQLKGDDNTIDYRNLAVILNALYENDVIDGFTRDGARQIIASFDENKSGRVEFPEFNEIIKRCSDWRSIFKQYDKNRNNKINVWELRSIMEDLGHRLGYSTLASIVRWFGDRDGQMSFEDFAICVFRLFGAAKAYKRLLPNRETRSQVSLDEWLVASFTY